MVQFSPSIAFDEVKCKSLNKLQVPGWIAFKSFELIFIHIFYLKSYFKSVFG